MKTFNYPQPAIGQDMKKSSAYGSYKWFGTAPGCMPEYTVKLEYDTLVHGNTRELIIKLKRPDMQKAIKCAVKIAWSNNSVSAVRVVEAYPMVLQERRASYGVY